MGGGGGEGADGMVGITGMAMARSSEIIGIGRMRMLVGAGR